MLLLLVAAVPAAAQEVSVWLNTSASHSQPPADVTADASQFGLLGGRVTGHSPWGSATVHAQYGDALAGTDGRWVQGDATVATGGKLGPFGLRGVLSGFGLRYLSPFSYDAGGVEIRPSLSYPAGRFVLSAVPRVSVGRWSTTAVEGDLRVAGGSLEVQRTFGALIAVLSGGASSVDNGVVAGTFARAGGDLILDRGRWTASAHLEAQRTPVESEVGGGVRVSWSLAPGLELQGYAGRRVRDPLFGTAGSLTASMAVSVRAGRWSPPAPPPVARVGEARDGGRMVSFAIRAPGADQVALTGDFTGWEPVAMESDGDWWHLSRVVAPGLQHFGFLVDGSWAIPESAPGVVEDGWGRRNASIVVEP